MRSVFQLSREIMLRVTRIDSQKLFQAATGSWRPGSPPKCPHSENCQRFQPFQCAYASATAGAVAGSPKSRPVITSDNARW